METAVFSAHNPESAKLEPHERNIAVLLDTAAQRSLISRETVDRLGLRITSIEPALLQGFEQVKPKTLNYQVAEVVIGKPGHKPVKLDALVINKLNSIHMSGACAFAQKLSAKNVPLADFRFLTRKSDIIQADLLIGNDYRNLVVNPKRPHIQVLCGMWRTC